MSDVDTDPYMVASELLEGFNGSEAASSTAAAGLAALLGVGDSGTSGSASVIGLL